MMPLYLMILLGSISIPLLYSIFKTDFIKDWKSFFVSTSIVAAIFLIWDAIFTTEGVWGFNEEYCVGVYFLQMPIEEWLFFYLIPFCSLFTHFALFYACPQLKVNKKITIIIALSIIFLAIVTIATNYTKMYTLVDCVSLTIVLMIGLIYNIELLQQFFISFLIILIPFFIVNGILTGLLTDEPIVWYDNTENLGIRLFTIPIEDIGYAFTMLFGNLLIYSHLSQNRSDSGIT